MSNSANIRDIDALRELNVAFGRFGEDVLEILPSIQKQLEEVLDWLEERVRFWQREIDEAQEAVQYKRGALESCEASGYRDEEGNYNEPDCSFEENDLQDAKKRLRECEFNLETAKRWQFRIEDRIADFRNEIYKLSNLASAHVGGAQAFLANKIEILRRYIAPYSSGTQPNLQFSIVNDSLTRDTYVTSASDVRDVIRNAQYTSSLEVKRGQANRGFILKNGVKVYFKPSGGEGPKDLRPGIKSGTQYLREKAASIIDEWLGIGLIPPTEVITYRNDKGSAQLYKEFESATKLMDLGAIKFQGYEVLSDRQRHDWQLLDEILGNSDRHDSNWMLGFRSKGRIDLALIDNGLCLSDTGYKYLLTKPASQEPIDAVNLCRIKRLLEEQTEWKSRIRGLVSDSAIEHMITRAKDLLQRGYYE